jgi:hypothetical protein
MKVGAGHTAQKTNGWAGPSHIDSDRSTVYTDLTATCTCSKINAHASLRVTDEE